MKKTSDLIWQDAQHQQLFKLIDQINQSSVDESIFHQLNDYAENHFRLEEEYMRRLNFPAADAHMQAHDKFRTELQIMMRNHADYDDVFRQALTEFLTGWLKGHIFGIDKQLEQFILQSDRK